jgi:hypothetical protein
MDFSEHVRVSGKTTYSNCSADPRHPPSDGRLSDCRAGLFFDCHFHGVLLSYYHEVNNSAFLRIGRQFAIFSDRYYLPSFGCEVFAFIVLRSYLRIYRICVGRQFIALVDGVHASPADQADFLFLKDWCSILLNIPMAYLRLRHD